MVDRVFGYNVAQEFLIAQNKAFDLTEANAHELIDTLKTLNGQNRDLQKLTTALTNAKKDKKDVNLAEDKELKAAMERIHALDPHIFGATHQTLSAKDFHFKHDDIDTTLALLDTKVKDQVSKINETTMYINQNYEDRIQFTENAQKTLEMLIRHSDSIISKTTRG